MKRMENRRDLHTNCRELEQTLMLVVIRKIRRAFYKNDHKDTERNAYNCTIYKKKWNTTKYIYKYIYYSLYVYSCIRSIKIQIGIYCTSISHSITK